MLNRRSFLQTLGLAAPALVLPWQALSTPHSLSEPTITTLGIIADTHQDIIHDAEQRLAAFMEEVAVGKPDFILQLGDFCEPKEKNRDFLRIWNQFEGPRFHVLGNHDMDSAGKEKTMDFWEMPGRFYSFDHAGFHFVVLDANYLYLDGKFVDYDTANFYIDGAHRTWIPPEQLEWLEADLRETSLSTVIFTHQGLANDAWGIKNRTQIQVLLERINKEAGFNKVIACINGHNHIDRVRTINGIHYIDINSASYQWLGEKYQCTTRYPKELYE